MITRWQPEWNTLLGKEPDRPLARRLGVDRATVVRWRARLGIAAAQPGPEWERFLTKVSPEPMSGCWLWTAGLIKGYGSFRHNRKTVYAHKLAYEWSFGPVPAGLELDHLCRVRSCVNPRHLEPVTHQVNMLRGASPSSRQRRLKMCQRGHDWTIPGNVYVLKTGPMPAARTARSACWNARALDARRTGARHDGRRLGALQPGARFGAVLRVERVLRGVAGRIRAGEGASMNLGRST